MPLSKLFPCFQFKLEDNINKLDYSNHILSAGFPQVWQYERTLEELNITSTRINYLPPQLFYCQGLKILIANNNNIENVPEAIGALRQLQQLNLSKNFISNVPDNIKACKHLTLLDLSCNALQKLPDAITCLISLQELILNETYLEFLPANFGRLVNLRIVELRSNNLISLPKSMQRLTNLQRLDIGSNEFTILPEVIGELKQLRELWFDLNQIQNLPTQIGKLRELLHCEANGNCFSFLPNEISNWRNLEVLSLSTNNLSSFPFSVGMLKTLVTLKCELNDLTELPDSISNLENLEELVLSHNKLKRLPHTIGMLKKLRCLFVDENNLQKLPDEICSCSLLSVLSVSKNKISELPGNIGHLIHLKVLNIVQNKIVTLPVTLLSLVNLTSLWISNNQSQPLIPLQYTDMSKKQLTCFMLPQQGSVQYSTQLNDENQKSTHKYTHLKKTSEQSDCSIFNRRICFSEETTIMDTIKASPKSCNNDNNHFLFPFTNSSSSMLANGCNGSVLPRDNDKQVPVGSKDFLMRSPTPYPKELRLMAKYVRENHNKSVNAKNETVSFIDDKNNCHHSTTPTQNASNILDENKYGNHGNTTELHLKTNDNNDLHFKTYDNLQILPSCNQPNENLDTEKVQFGIVLDNTQKPPPYHIARCFTKKTVEDLTNYEVSRKQQEHKNIDCKNNVRPLDYQNNLMVQQYEQRNESIHGYAESDKLATITNNQKDILDSLHISKTNKSTKKLTNKAGTTWLFGVHRNPRVIQVTISCGNGRDFEVDFLPNKEGIYVISTVPESNASQLLYPFDKLLEVDGIDFTNISINKARQVLNNSRPLTNIMLSRK